MLACSIDSPCHPDGAVFWRRRTYATLPVRPVRPAHYIRSRPAKSAAHQDDKRRCTASASGSKRMMLKPFQTQIPPSRIDGHDQRNLPDPQPALDLFLAFDGFMHILVALEVHKPIKFVFACELRSRSKFVPPHSSNEIPGYPGIQSLRAVRHDVDEVSLRLAHNVFSLNASQH